MIRGATLGRAICAAGLSAAALVAGPTPAIGEAITPKAGTYAGAGSMTDDDSDGMQVGFTLDGTTVDVAILGFSAPGCNGFTSVPQAALIDKRFTTSASSPNRDILLKGRWVKPNTVKGKMVMTVPVGTNCGTPGTYVYRYKARRYGGV